MLRPTDLNSSWMLGALCSTVQAFEKVWESVRRLVQWVSEHNGEMPSASKAPKKREEKQLYELRVRLVTAFNEGRLQQLPPRNGERVHEFLDRTVPTWSDIKDQEAKSNDQANRFVSFRQQHGRQPKYNVNKKGIITSGKDEIKRLKLVRCMWQPYGGILLYYVELKLKDLCVVAVLLRC